MGTPGHTVNSSLWSRKVKYCSSDIRVTYSLADRNESSIQDPCQLPSGDFTWVVTADNQFTFGRIQNTLEWGTKHIALANRREVYAAGELMVLANSTTIQWNLNSGTYHWYISKTLQSRTEQVWNASSCATRYTSSAVSVGPPSASYLGEVCDQLVAQNATSRMVYTWSGNHVCPDNYVQCSASAPLGTPIPSVYRLLSGIAQLLLADKV